MPLRPNYTWSESTKAIQLCVPLKGHGKNEVDVFATECYLKVSFPPYLLELDLHGCIDSGQSRARVEKGVLIIKARKKQDNIGTWGLVGTCADRKCDPEVRARRENSIKEELKREQELKERKSLRRHEDERLALRSQMNLEEAERRRIEDIKAEEKEKAEEEVYRAFAELAAKQEDSKQPTSQLLPEQTKSSGQELPISPHSPQTCGAESDGKGLSNTIQREEIWCDDDLPPEEGGGRSELSGGSNHDASQRQEQVPFEDTKGHEDEIDIAESYVPEPREPIDVVPIGFTTRLFPTPLRESKVADESAWIMKNRKYLHTNKTLVGRLPSPGQGDLPLGISESDPVWLKGRGDDLYRGGDYRSAISAYTSALEANPDSTGCLSNRAACYLRIGQMNSCIVDCTAALGILRTSPSSAVSQARVFARRALAYRELGHYRPSLEDYRAALELSPGDATLIDEVTVAEPLATCETSKKEAAARFAAGDIAGAFELYTAALVAVPAFPSCLSNRAACHLALGRPEGCVEDCTAALSLLSADPSGRHAGDSIDRAATQSSSSSTPAKLPPPGSAPSAGSDKRRAWVLSTLLRRGRAYVEFGRLNDALQDYRTASSLSPEDKTIQQDVLELEQRKQESETASAH